MLYKTKRIKIGLVVIVSIIGLFIVWLNLPMGILYHSEIKFGNEFSTNIIEYKKEHGQLPSENDLENLSSLNPIKPYENFYPEYKIIDKDNFCLTYIEGFDPPYLQYSTNTKKWEKQ